MDMDAKITKYFERINYGAVQRVRKESDMVLWPNSIAYHELVTYINRTSTAIQGVRQLQPDAYPVSATMLRLCGIFDRLTLWLTQSKPGAADAYRSWSLKMLRNIFNMLEQALPRNKCEHVSELGQYLAGSFGNYTRVDYGTGHELSFVFFLCGLFRAQILLPADEPAAALMLFNRYLSCVRRLQTQFDLKPAGNQGAYSLDDYQFVAFLWGAAQLCYHAPFKPKQLLDAETLAQWRSQYLIAGCVAFVASTKLGNFSTHSSQLWSVTALSSWTHVYHGIHNMYLKEVICQFHLLRHICFGRLMRFDPAPSTSQLKRPQLGFLSIARQQYLSQAHGGTGMPQQQKQHGKRQEEEQEDEDDSLLPKHEISHSALSTGKSVTSLSGTSVHLHSLAKRLSQLQEKHAKMKADLRN